MPGLSVKLLPVTSLLALLFGLGYVWLGVAELREGDSRGGVGHVVFGVIGVALAVAIWRAKRRLR